jgi:hypothetical protein
MTCGAVWATPWTGPSRAPARTATRGWSDARTARRRVHGRSAEGSTFPGFRVAAVVPGRELVLGGRHRFSSYALIFRLEPAGPGRSRLTAETRARFPGPAGGLYRLLVLGTGGHAVGVRRLLAAVRRRAES